MPYLFSKKNILILIVILSSLPRCLIAATPSPQPPPTDGSTALSRKLHLTCQWLDPNTGTPLKLEIANNGILVVPAGGVIRSVARWGQARLRLLKSPPESTPRGILVALSGEPHAVAGFSLTAPNKPGAYIINLPLWAAGSRSPSNLPPQNFSLCVFVPYPSHLSRANSGRLTVNGTVIGNYRAARKSGIEKVRQHPQAYKPPAFFVQLTPTARERLLMPYLQLQDLVVPTEKTGKRHTNYTPVRYPLLAAIQQLRSALAARGIPPRALVFLSIFRTPGYNHSIGSGAYSRHQYGDAIDFIIDQNSDQVMDDLNKDGRVDKLDGLWLVEIIEDLQADGKIPLGGIGIYSFADNKYKLTMHLDLRGHRARWAYYYDRRGRKREFSWKSKRFYAQDEAERLARLKKAAGRK